jgi:hypothetical protein
MKLSFRQITANGAAPLGLHRVSVHGFVQAQHHGRPILSLTTVAILY